MPQNPSVPPKSSSPGGERGVNRSNYLAGGTSRPPRPQTAAQRALNPGRAAHAASEARGNARGMSRGRAQGIGIGAGVVGTAALIKGAYDNQMAENAKFDAFNRGKVAGRQTDSAGRSTSPVGKTPKATYKAPMTKALIADGAKPVMKPK